MLSVLPGSAQMSDSVNTGYFELIVTSVPADTPPEESIYIVGNFNNWVNRDEQYKLHKNADNTYSVRIQKDFDTLIYKYNRGTWETVEGDRNGNLRADRMLVRSNQSPTYQTDQILTWENLGVYVFVIEEVPENTPVDGNIYITGNFNNWKPGDPKYRFDKQEDGTYKYVLKSAPAKLEYKFTRGTWDTVEGGGDGRAIQNRRSKREGSGPETIYTTIKSWEDFEGNSLSYYDFTLILSATIGLLIIVAFGWMQNGNIQVNIYLLLTILILIITSIARVAMNFRGWFNWEPRLVLLPDVLYFSLAPLMYFYLQALLGLKPRISVSKWLSFVPLAIMIIAYIPLLIREKQDFIDQMVLREYHDMFAIVAGVGLIYNTFYWYRCIRLQMAYTRKMDNTYSFDQSHYYSNSLITLFGICLFVWLSAYLIGGAGIYMEMNTIPVTDTISDITWMIVSGLPFFVAYFAINQPELFRMTEASEKYRFSNLSEESVLDLKGQLGKLMLDKKPFLNPKLTLLELAEMIETNTHTLSRVINEGFDRNFYDFVNWYRVEEFKELVNQEQYKNLTFLAIAYEVGFSSKTTFNRAFKKLEGITPREYHRKLVDEGATEDLNWV